MASFTHQPSAWPLRLARVTIVLTCCSLVLQMVALLSPYWMHVTLAMGSSHSGLWTVCIFGRCDKFVHHRLYAWFHWVQSLMVLSLLAELVTASCVTLYTYRLRPRTPSAHDARLLTAAVTSQLTTLLMTLVAITLYGAYQVGDPRDLSWGYHVTLVAVTFQAAILCVLVRLRCSRDVSYKQDVTPIVDVDTSYSKLNGTINEALMIPKSTATFGGRTRAKQDGATYWKTESRPINTPTARMRSYSTSQLTPNSPAVETCARVSFDASSGSS